MLPGRATYGDATEGTQPFFRMLPGARELSSSLLGRDSSLVSQYVWAGLQQLPVAVSVFRSSLASEVNIKSRFASVGCCGLVLHIQQLVDTICNAEGCVTVSLSGDELRGDVPCSWVAVEALIPMFKHKWDLLVSCSTSGDPIPEEVLDSVEAISGHIGHNMERCMGLLPHVKVTNASPDMTIPEIVIDNTLATACVFFSLTVVQAALVWTLHNDGLLLPVLCTLCCILVSCVFVLTLLPLAQLRETLGYPVHIPHIRSRKQSPRMDLPLAPSSAFGGIVITLDKQHQITAWNTAAKEALGFEYGDVKGKAIECVLNTKPEFLTSAVSTRRQFVGLPLTFNVRANPSESDRQLQHKQIIASVVFERDTWTIMGVVNPSDPDCAMRYFSALGQFLIGRFSEDLEGIANYLQLMPAMVDRGVRWWVHDDLVACIHLHLAQLNVKTLLGDSMERYYDRGRLADALQVLSRNAECVRSIIAEECDEDMGNVFSLHVEIRVFLQDEASEQHLRNELLDARACVMLAQGDPKELVVIVPVQKVSFADPCLGMVAQSKPAKLMRSPLRAVIYLVEQSPVLRQNLKCHLSEAMPGSTIVVSEAEQIRKELALLHTKIHCLVAPADVWKTLKEDRSLEERLKGLVRVGTTSQCVPSSHGEHPLVVPMKDQKPLASIVEKVKGVLLQEMNDVYISDKFERIKFIGSGAAATIYRGESLWSHARVALKCYNLAGRRTASREGDAFRRIQQNAPKDKKHFEDGYQYIAHPISIKKECLVLELCDRTLREALDAHSPSGMTNESVRKACPKWTKEILQGVLFLHTNNIAHKDLKPENIMLTESNEIRIIDLGSAALDKDSFSSTSFGQTMLYAPPGERADSFEDCCKADIWAVGLITLELLGGRLPPRKDLSVPSLQCQVREGPFTDSWKQLLQQMICAREHRRSAAELVKMIPENDPQPQTLPLVE